MVRIRCLLKEQIMLEENGIKISLPFTFLFAENTAAQVASAPESGVALEIDTKDPYSDNSDTI